ncbi:Alpha/Beta hydrolase protein [Mycena leptocephala]|nr:Alpha/Beta hydrolase protein [Mycena leptocephala]
MATPIVDLGYAKYQGTVNTTTNTTTFLGIRYTATPINDAFKPQAGRLPLIRTLVSATRATQKVPRVVHFQSLFGFMAEGAEVKKNGALNAGLRKGLVVHIISKFGGDPSKVTLWVESAGMAEPSLFFIAVAPGVTGAGSALQHVVANNGQSSPQLFGAAITSSTFLPSQYKYDDRIPEFSSCSAAIDSMACLRTAGVDVLQTVNLNINAAAFYGTFAFVPVVDGEFITRRPDFSCSRQGQRRQSDIRSICRRFFILLQEALLSVTNSCEGATFVDQSTATTANATQYALDLIPNFGSVQAEVAHLYAGLGAPLFQEAIMGESIFICPTYYLMTAFAGRAFKGEFAVPPAPHKSDLPYYFPSLVIDFPVSFPVLNNTGFINAFAKSFTSFVISLDPNTKVDNATITPAWSKWDVGQTEMLFNQTVDDLPLVEPDLLSSLVISALVSGTLCVLNLSGHFSSTRRRSELEKGLGVGDTHEPVVVDERTSVHHGVYGIIQEHNALQAHIFVQGGVELGSKREGLEYNMREARHEEETRTEMIEVEIGVSEDFIEVEIDGGGYESRIVIDC